ncbi:hypothetical protein V8G54_002644 [Vigna mungo]|uniref:Uncharacterized protein n=1 Tax=Vigna mungo TaxID=3915 RepID=A0AAQ3PAL8_VIGMU
MVILADKNRRKIPKRRNVKRLEQLPLIGSTITVQRKRNSLILRILLSKSQSTTKRNLSPYNAMPTVEATLFPVKVHGTTFPLRATVAAAHELGEDLDQGSATAQEGAVVTVSSDDAVLARDRGLHPHRNGLLPVVEMAEAADQLGLIEGVRRDLHPPHQRHVTEEREELRRRGLDGA